MRRRSLRHFSYLILHSLLVLIHTSICIGAEIQVHDEHWKLELFAADPDIVTPIGMCVDDGGRVFVIESHTHHPPSHYSGPKGDVIKIFIDENNDGKVDEIKTAAQGFDAAMNLIISQEGVLFLVCAREVWRLEDHDSDGVFEYRSKIIEVHTENKYAHSCLLGITLGNDGWLYISRGNNGSVAYRIEGSDQSKLEGYGDGGQVVRCRPDGSGLESFATGFWNPFDIEFDMDGRLLCVDNDPDARGPNRLVHVVEGGDYGYKSAYGGGGNHPFQGWDGELPGTLPFVSGTGEAPSGLLDLRRVRSFESEGFGVLTTIWNENSIERHNLSPSGLSVEGISSSVWMSGPKDFRPVAIDTDSRGNIYVTDWVLVDYPNHGRGRIWKITPLDTLESLKPQSYWSHAESGPFAESSEKHRDFSLKNDESVLLNGLESKDSFKRHQTVLSLAKNHDYQDLLAFSHHESENVRLGILLACQLAGKGSSIPVAQWKSWLTDENDKVVQACLIWIGESNREDLRLLIESVLSRSNLSPMLFHLALSCEARLDSKVVSSIKNHSQSKANRLINPISQARIWSIALNPRFSESTRALAISMCDFETIMENEDVVIQWLQEATNPIQTAVIQILPPLVGNKVHLLLRKMALNEDLTTALRLEALYGLSPTGLTEPESLLPLLRDKESSIQLAAARVLQPFAQMKSVKQALTNRYISQQKLRKRSSLLEQLEFNLSFSNPKNTELREHRPRTSHDWENAIQYGGDSESGSHVFRSARAGCVQCHTIQGQGGLLGPDLSNLGQSVDRHQILRSILAPSDTFPPQYQAWEIETIDGETHEGLQLDHKANGAIELLTLTRDVKRFEVEDIQDYRASKRSLMPEGLVENLSVSEVRDIVAFLESLN